MNKKWVTIVDDDEAVFCLGVFDTKEEAIGRAHLKIAKFACEYTNEGDTFSTGTLRADGYGGYYILIEFKDAEWEKSHQGLYRILPVDD